MNNLRSSFLGATLALVLPLTALYSQPAKPQLIEVNFLKDGNPVTSTGNGDIRLELKFDQAMQDTITPTITFGLDEPYNISLNFNQSLWTGNPVTVWQGTLTISANVPQTEDGYYTFKISGAVSAGGDSMNTTLSTEVGNKRLRICRQGQILASMGVIMFPKTLPPSSKDTVLVFQNLSCYPLSISSLVFHSPFSISNYTGAFQVPGDGQTNLTVRFSPAQRGTYTDTLVVNSDDPVNPRLAIPLQGIAAAPEISITPSETINFGVVAPNVASTRTITISNTFAFNSNWNANLVVSGVTTSDTAFKVQSAGFTVTPGLNRELAVTFLSAERRSFDAKLRITNNDPDESLKEITLLANSSDITPPGQPAAISGNWYVGYWTNDDTLCLTWTNPTDPSGIAEVRWKIDSPPTNANDSTGSIRQNNVTSFCLPIQDFDLHRVYYWLIDGQGNSGWLNPRYSWFRYDNTAPGVPLSTRIRTGNNWTRDDTVSVYWTNPAATAGDFYEVRWKLKSRPSSANDFTGHAPLGVAGNSRFFTIQFNQNFCGEDSCFFWLADSAGNANYGNPASVRYRYDSCLPEIARVLPDTVTATKRTTFIDTLRITDDVGVDSAWVRYRFGGAEAEEGQPLLLNRKPGSRDKFILDIPADAVTTRGLEYRITARDSLGNKYAYGPGWGCDGQSGDKNQWYPVQVRMLGSGEFRIDSDNRPVPLTPGNEQTNYHLVSVPFLLNDGRARTVLTDDLGEYDNTKWRFFEYRTADKQLIEYPNTENFEPGRAFFIIVAEANKVIRSGPGKTVATICPDTLTLEPGWNLIADPFNFPIAKDKLRLVNSSIPLSLRSYEGGWNIVDTIEPWRGYAIYVQPQSEENKIYLLVEPKAIVPRASKAASAARLPGQWTLQIIASSGAARDRINWAGTRPDASAQYDDNDLFEPPVIGNYVSVYFPHPEWPRHPENYTADYRPLSADGHVWDFKVAAGKTHSMVTLTFDGWQEVPDDLEVYLIDEALGTARNLRQNPTYTYRAGEAGSSKSLKLVVGSRQYVEANSGNVTLVPTNFELAQNFPNPFNPETVIRYALPQASTVTLEVYNLLGQKVRTLVDHAPQPADFYLVSWDGRDERGEAIATGVYLYRLVAGQFVSTRKMVFMK